MQINKERIINSKSLSVFLTIIILIYAILVLIFSDTVAKATKMAIERCINVIIPSFFGFMVVTNVIVKSDMYILISKPFYFLSKYILKIRPELFSIFLISNIGGYPIGIRTITEMLDNNKITKQEAERMICFCYSCAPSFIFTVVGLGLFGNIKTGLYIYLSIVISNIIIAFITGKKENNITKNTKQIVSLKFNTKILIDSVISTAKALFLICIMIIFFTVFISVISQTGLLNLLNRLICSITGFNEQNTFSAFNSLLEISNVSQFQRFSFNAIPIITALLSFGGTCVFLQIISICNKSFSLKKYYITRPFQIILSSLISYCIIRFSDISISAISYSYTKVCYTHNNPIGFICLGMMVICLLIKLCIDKDKIV